MTLVSFSVSCVEEQFGNESTNPISDPNAIQFGASTNSMETKTVFGDKVGTGSDAYWQVFWDNTEEYVEIFCPDAYNETEEDVLLAEYEVKAINKAADGTVSDAAAGTSSKGQITPRVDGKYLKWGGDSGKHRFYAAYPAKCAYISQHADSVGIMTFKINNNQVCTIPTNATSPFVAEPDMDYAYMVGTGEGEPASGKVALDFDPIMTTLTVTVTAAQTNLDASTTITGISIISSVASVDALNGIFKYNAKSGSVLLGQTTTPKTVSTFVGIKHGDSNHIDLKSGESVTFTVFLPPVGIGPIDADNPAQSPIEIRVHRAGNANLSAYIGKSKEEGDSSPAIYAANKTIKPSTKCSVVLPSLPAPDATATGNNWITPLDDNIYVSQLSIPGTHDAATSGCSLSQGRCQSYTITEQLNMGIRAFDLRPSLDTRLNLGITVTGLGDIYHGLNSTGVSMGDAMTYFDSYLKNNPKEFVIILMRWESDRYVLGGGSESDYASYMKEFLTNNAVYQSRKVAFKPDLTIGDMRGGILIISRNNLSPNGTYETSHTGWNHNNYDGYVNTISGTGGSTSIYIQDMFSPGENGDSSNEDFLNKKIELVKAMMDRTATFHTNPSMTNVWAINHCSGYAGSAIDPRAYANNGNSTNLQAYEYLTGTEKPVGSTGIIMLDFVGARDATVGNLLTDVITVYGDLMPQAIIDNNYKYVMKRKGE